MTAISSPDTFLKSGRVLEPERPARLVLSSGEFVKQFRPLDYLMHGVLLRGFLYSFTALTGVGKTAIALNVAMSVALGRAIGDIEVEQGRVLYLGGENPDDLRMRWIAMAEMFEFDPISIGVYFVAGVFNIAEMRAKVETELKAIGGVSLIIVDTSAAYFDGAQENDNVELGNYARMLRTLVQMPGAPTVLVLSHPTKGASKDNLLPRGGGAFINEVDGNLIAYGDRPLAEVHWQGKWRGVDFEPLQFEMVTARSDRIRDSKGRQIPTVAAKYITDREQGERVKEATSDQDALLITMLDHDGASIAELAIALGWQTKAGEPYKSKVQKLIEALAKDKAVSKFRGKWGLTPTGKKEAERLRINRGLAGARY